LLFVVYAGWGTGEEQGQEGGLPAQSSAIRPKLPDPLTALVWLSKTVVGTRRLVPANEISVLRL